MRTLRGSVLLALLVGGCAQQLPTDPDIAGVDGGASSLRDGTPDVVGVLAFLNHPSTTVDVLDVRVPLDSRAAENLIAHRNGADNVLGTADDDPFDGIAEVDAVTWVGPSALSALADFARANGWVPEGDALLGTWDDVAFSANEAAATLSLVNTASFDTLDVTVALDLRAVESIFEARPVDSILELSGLYYVGASALLKLRDFQPGLPAGAAGSDCSMNADCNGGLRCVGIPFDGSPEIGKCADTTTQIPGDGDPCSLTDPCNAGLVCAGTTVYDGEGYCRASWMEGTYVSLTSMPITDGGVITSDLVIYGQASVPEDIVLTLDIDHPRPQDLKITIRSTNGSEGVVWNHAAGNPNAPMVVWGLERDNYVNGKLTCEIEDTVTGESGTLRGYSVYVTSRYD